MHVDIFSISERICIVINKDFEIQYSSIELERAYGYLKRLNSSKDFSTGFWNLYVEENWCVSMEKFYFADQLYYVILMSSKVNDCNSCNRFLIDEATGLYNRNYWERISRGAHSLHELGSFSLVLIDIDNLKKINDTYGHLEGDRAIKLVGEVIRGNIRKEDIGIRYGGDEFIVLLLNQDLKAADKTVEKIKKETNKKASKENTYLHISTGVACTDCYNSIEELIKAADKNLYKEKEIKRKQEKVDSCDLRNLRKDLEFMRNDLSKKAMRFSKDMRSSEILKIFQEINDLTSNLLKNISEYDL